MARIFMMIYVRRVSMDRVFSRRFSVALLLFSSLPLLNSLTGCCSPQQTYPTPYGNSYGQGVPINQGYYAPPQIVNGAPQAQANYPAGMIAPNNTVIQPGQVNPYGTSMPVNGALPQYGAPQGAYPPGYAPTAYPNPGYQQGVPFNAVNTSPRPIFGS